MVVLLQIQAWQYVTRCHTLRKHSDADDLTSALGQGDLRAGGTRRFQIYTSRKPEGFVTFACMVFNFVSSSWTGFTGIFLLRHPYLSTRKCGRKALTCVGSEGPTPSTDVKISTALSALLTVARSCWSAYLGSMLRRKWASTDSSNRTEAVSFICLMASSGWYSALRSRSFCTSRNRLERVCKGNWHFNV